MITKRVGRVMDILFNGVKRDNNPLILVNKKSTPNGHSFDAVIFRLSTLSEENPNVITEWTGGATGFCK